MSVYEITTKDQMDDLLKHYEVVVVDIWASWCNPCKMLAPKYESLATRYSSPSVIFCKNDANTGLFEVSGLPNIDFYVRGRKTHTVMGADIVGIEDYLKELGVPSKQVTTQQQSNSSTTLNQPVRTGSRGGKRGDAQYKSYGNYS